MNLQTLSIETTVVPESQDNDIEFFFSKLPVPIVAGNDEHKYKANKINKKQQKSA